MNKTYLLTATFDRVTFTSIDGEKHKDLASAMTAYHKYRTDLAFREECHKRCGWKLDVTPAIEILRVNAPTS